MANQRGKEIDTTHLSIDQAEDRGFIHRDYIAHCLRWTHVAKFMQKSGRYKTAQVLDIGCGVDLPLAKMLYSSRYIVEDYVGIDYNKTSKFKMEPFHTGKFPVSAYGNTEFPVDIKISGNSYAIDPDDPHPLPNVITCFEVLEHVEPAHARAMLETMHEMLGASRGTAFVSTPCYNPEVGAAANHVNEMNRVVLGCMIEESGFEVVGNWGTFASQRDYKDQFFNDYADGRAIWNKLSEYYDSNYLATILAPLYPERSRNNLWEIRPAGDDYQPQFLWSDAPKLEAAWTSSKNTDQLKSSKAYWEGK